MRSLRNVATRAGAVCMSASVLLHLGLLLASAQLVLHAGGDVRLVRVTLLPGGGAGDSAGGSPGEMQPSAKVVVAPPAQEPARAAARARPIAKAAPQLPPKKVAVARQKLERVAEPRPAAAPVDAVEQRSAAPAVEQAAPEDTSGRQGTGIGLAGGSGTGAGGEVGRGTGSGRGDGVGDGVEGRTLCAHCPEPIYPMIARRRGWEGTVDLSLLLLPSGTVGDVDVRTSSGHEVLDREALRVARRSRFLLPERETRPLRARIQYRFVLAGGR